jgi:ribonuclease HI
MPWIRHRLRDADVWAKVDNSGALVTDRDGRVEIVYKAEPGTRVYRAGARNLTSPSGDPIEIEVGEPAKSSTPPLDAVHVWTDGACTGNPGPAGLGVVIIDGKTKARKELSEYLGQGTNNIAELTAILRGLEEVTKMIEDLATRTVVVYSDSKYSLDMLTKPQKPKKNIELVGKLRALKREFKDLRFVKVLGHSGIPLNERVDELARLAVSRGT